MRPTSINGLLVSLQSQTLQPDVIIIIDGSTNKDTYELLNHRLDTRLTYFLVPPELRGLTKQRNFGISKVAKDIDVVCFLDDDVLLESDYFEQLIKTYSIYPEAFSLFIMNLFKNSNGIVFISDKIENLPQLINRPVNKTAKQPRL